VKIKVLCHAKAGRERVRAPEAAPVSPLKVSCVCVFLWLNLWQARDQCLHDCTQDVQLCYCLASQQVPHQASDTHASHTTPNTSHSLLTWRTYCCSWLPPLSLLGLPAHSTAQHSTAQHSNTLVGTCDWHLHLRAKAYSMAMVPVLPTPPKKHLLFFTEPTEGPINKYRWCA